MAHKVHLYKELGVHAPLHKDIHYLELHLEQHIPYNNLAHRFHSIPRNSHLLNKNNEVLKKEKKRRYQSIKVKTPPTSGGGVVGFRPPILSISTVSAKKGFGKIWGGVEWGGGLTLIEWYMFFPQKLAGYQFPKSTIAIL